MNKREKAELEAAKVVAALRWTSPVDPDVDIPKSYQREGAAFGYTFNERSGRIGFGWSTAYSHGSGDDPMRNGSQGGVRMYSSRLLALRAMRHAMEIMFAEKLRVVDRAIEAEATTATEETEP